VINIQKLKDFKHDLERHDLYFKEQNENVAILNKSNKKLIDKIKVFLNKIKISNSLLKTHRIHVDELKQLVIKFNSKTKEKIIPKYTPEIVLNTLSKNFSMLTSILSIKSDISLK